MLLEPLIVVKLFGFPAAERPCVGVANVHQIETVRRHRLARQSSVCMLDNGRHVVHARLAESDIDKGTDNRARHLAHETVSFQVDADEMVNSPARNPSDRTNAVAPYAYRDEGTDIMATDQREGRSAHGIYIQMLAYVGRSGMPEW